MSREYHMIIPASYLVFRRDNEVLLLRRFNTGYRDGMYSLPAGHVEAGESALQAAVREAQEEVAVNLNNTKLTLIHTMYRANMPPDGSGTERVDLFFEAYDWPGEPINNEPDKCDELLWVDIASLPDNILPEVRQALECIAASENYSDVGF